MIKKGTPTEQELQSLAEEIPEDWKRLGRAVGLKEKHLKIIEIDNPDSVFERALATLIKWKEKQGQEATYQKLATALDDELVQRRDLVETFCCDIYPSKQVGAPLQVSSEKWKTRRLPLKNLISQDWSKD